MADIVQTVADLGEFNTLIQLLQAAELESTLKGPGPFTLFAPRDAAFSKLPRMTLEPLFHHYEKEKLVALLLGHVAPGRFGVADLAEGAQLATAGAGRPLAVGRLGEDATVGGARVLRADIHCDNGVIHVLDEPILPA